VVVFELGSKRKNLTGRFPLGSVLRPDQLEADVPEWQRQLAEAKEQLAAVAADEAAESQKLRALRLKLEEGRSALSANTSRSRVLDGLMEQKRYAPVVPHRIITRPNVITFLSTFSEHCH